MHRMFDKDWIMGGIGGVSAVVMGVGGTNDWSSRAYTAVGAAGVVLSGCLYGLGKLDRALLERKKTWEEFNKTSLTTQLEQISRESIENQKKMRESLHDLRNKASAASLENTDLREELRVLRQQFLEISRELKQTDIDLHEANRNLRSTSDMLAIVQKELIGSQADRAQLRRELDDMKGRLVKLEDTPASVPGP